MNGIPDAPYEMPITEEQLELWLACQFGHDLSCGFNLSYSMYFRGDFQLDAMRKAFEQLVHRHDSLRMTISPDGEKLRFLQSVNLKFQFMIFRASKRRNANRRLKRCLSDELETAYDLTNGPMVRVQIAKLIPTIITCYLVCITSLRMGFPQEFSCVNSVHYTPQRQQAAMQTFPHQCNTASMHNGSMSKNLPRHLSKPKSTGVGLCSNPFPPPLELPTDRPRPPFKTFRSTAYPTKIEKT